MARSVTPSFPITGDEAADQLLVEDPLALVLGMMLDQQVPMEWAFASPARLAERLGTRSLDATTIAAMDPDEVADLFARKPALHRYPGSMGRRAHALCTHLVEVHGGRADGLWTDVGSGSELARRLNALPGYGEEKTRIFVALLAKRFGIAPEGWEDAAGPFADAEPRSVADIDSRASFERVRAWKQAQKQKGRTKAQ